MKAPSEFPGREALGVPLWKPWEAHGIPLGGSGDAPGEPREVDPLQTFRGPGGTPLEVWYRNVPVATLDADDDDVEDDDVRTTTTVGRPMPRGRAVPRSEASWIQPGR